VVQIPTGATFTFGGSSGNLTAKVVGLTVETPTAEMVDMAGISDGAGQIVLVPTGSWTGGSISVEYIDATVDPQSFVRQTGVATFSSGQVTVSKRVILESASREIRVGDAVRGTLKFRITDYVG
jgi:hypothetical protein